jgi:hypothetical protein
MPEHRRDRQTTSPDFDYSTPEAQAALEGVTELILEIRDEAYQLVRLYERTLGLAVIPVLAARAARRVLKRSARARRIRDRLRERR